jgi:hypothetical protein
MEKLPDPDILTWAVTTEMENISHLIGDRETQLMNASVQRPFDAKGLDTVDLTGASRTVEQIQLYLDSTLGLPDFPLNWAASDLQDFAKGFIPLLVDLRETLVQPPLYATPGVFATIHRERRS